jgi:hypothetical protein
MWAADEKEALPPLIASTTGTKEGIVSVKTRLYPGLTPTTRMAAHLASQRLDSRHQQESPPSARGCPALPPAAAHQVASLAVTTQMSTAPWAVNNCDDLKFDNKFEVPVM